MIPLVAILLGIIAGLLIPYNIPAIVSPYLAIAILASLDSVLGAIAARMKHNFKLHVFFTGFFTNALLAALLTYIGNQLGVDLFLAATIMFGMRMFQNMASIRYSLIDNYRAKRRRQPSVTAAAAPQATVPKGRAVYRLRRVHRYRQRRPVIKI